jgi:hypothetical protein
MIDEVRHKHKRCQNNLKILSRMNKIQKHHQKNFHKIKISSSKNMDLKTFLINSKSTKSKKK